MDSDYIYYLAGLLTFGLILGYIMRPKSRNRKNSDDEFVDEL
jgi:hypothetical protein